MLGFKVMNNQLVHCRIGSLENFVNCDLSTFDVHCRIGSLEIKRLINCILLVHCRIGSLEILKT